tara:strand:+ start:237 stop:968 length:732 start_codon:yes stop_codon:yes gene_type:complete
MLNIIKGFVAPKVTELNTNVTLNTKDVSLVNLDMDVSIVIDALIDINNKYMSMLNNGSFLNVAYASFITSQMYKDQNHVKTINGVEYTRKELMHSLNPFLTSFKNLYTGKQMKSLMGKLYERKIPLSKILTDGYVISGLQSTINYIDANYELDGKKKVKNAPQAPKATPKAETKTKAKTETVNSIDTSKVETLDEAVETCITMLLDFGATEAEIANMVIKSLQKRNKKLMTTSNKRTVVYKVA